MHTRTFGNLSNTTKQSFVPYATLKMAQYESIEVQNLECLKVEESFKNRYVKVFDTLLLHGPIIDVKENMRLLSDQGTDIHNLHQYYFHLFATEQTPSFPEFIV